MMLQDPDFLETLFYPTMNFIDSRTEFTFWSLWSSPLLIATDIRNLGETRARLAAIFAHVSPDDEKKLIITNPEVIAIDQDPLVIAGDRLYNISGAQVR